VNGPTSSTSKPKEVAVPYPSPWCRCTSSKRRGLYESRRAAVLRQPYMHCGSPTAQPICNWCCGRLLRCGKGYLYLRGPVCHARRWLWKSWLSWPICWCWVCPQIHPKAVWWLWFAFHSAQQFDFSAKTTFFEWGHSSYCHIQYGVFISIFETNSIIFAAKIQKLLYSIWNEVKKFNIHVKIWFEYCLTYAVIDSVVLVTNLG